MPGKYLHIVSFNVPYPPDYGGVIDVYYKIRALYHAGIRIILHCFTYGRKVSPELEKLCFKVHYYQRHSGIRYYLSNLPYIVRTRVAKSMPDNLLNDSFPVLFEGLHTTDLMLRCKEVNKQVLFRAHNIEHEYYSNLSESEINPFKKIFFRTESKKLERYESVLNHTDVILGISKYESEYFKSNYGPTIFVPAFHKYNDVNINEGSGSYILYHGNLSVPENAEAVKYITRKIIARTEYRFVVSGKDPSEKLEKWLSSFEHVELVPNPEDTELERLISNAHINILFTFQTTGLKLKLLHTLFTGRHCIVNPMIIKGTDLDSVCHVVSSPDLAIRMINQLMGMPFTEEDILGRKKALMNYSNRANVEKIVRLLYPES